MRKLDKDHILIIITNNTRERAIELIIANEYTYTKRGAEEIIDRMNKK